MQKAVLGLIGIAVLGGVFTTLAGTDAVKLPAPVVDVALAKAGTQGF